MDRKLKSFGVIVSGVALSSLLSTAAFAQQAATIDAQAAQDDTGAGLQDIVVTAQRRSESAQNVPISVAAFSAESLANTGTGATTDLPSLVAGLTSAPNGSRNAMYLRGVGNNNFNAPPSVLTFVDGVYMPLDFGTQAYNDVSTMEIAKGPQGTLFGRNATGGVIQITTREPSQAPSAAFDVGYANYDTVSAKAYVSGGLTDNLRLGVAAFYDNQNNGWGTNIATGRDVWVYKRYGGRAKLVLDVSDVTTVKLAADYGYSYDTAGSAVNGPAGRYTIFNYLTGLQEVLPGKYDVNANFEPHNISKGGGGSLTVQSAIADVNLLSISAVRKAKARSFIDYDGTAIQFFDLTRVDNVTSYSQEFQVSSPASGRFKWVAGLFYFRQVQDMEPFSFGSPGSTAVFGTPPGQSLLLYAFDKTNAYAAYGQASLEVVKDTTLTLGARYTIEDRTQRGYVQAGAIVPSSVGGQSASFKKPTFRASIDHKLTSDVLLFASFNRGFNAGFFNPVSIAGFSAAANPVVRPEVIDAYEIGIKSQLFDRKLRINLSAFRYDYSNLQQQIFAAGGLTTVNAAAAKIQGIDLDIQARPVRNLDLGVSVSYLDPKYVSYKNAPNYSLLPNGAFLPTTGDASGFSTVQAPHISLNGSATYSLETGVGTFQTTASANYRGKTYADSFEKFPLKTRTLINLFERWESNDGGLSASVWVKNLLNEWYDVAANPLDPVALVGNRGAPRTYGLTLGYKFGS